MWPSQETFTFLFEVGQRAGLYSETVQRDARWFRGLFR